MILGLDCFKTRISLSLSAIITSFFNNSSLNWSLSCSKFSSESVISFFSPRIVSKRSFLASSNVSLLTKSRCVYPFSFISWLSSSISAWLSFILCISSLFSWDFFQLVMEDRNVQIRYIYTCNFKFLFLWGAEWFHWNIKVRFLNLSFCKLSVLIHFSAK